MKSQRCTYSIDWLQMFCQVPNACPPSWETKVSPDADRWGNHREYKLVAGTSFIKGYEWQREVIYRNYTIATIACQPKDDRMRRDGGAIKINNAVLYVADWYFILNDVLHTLGWQPLNITRVDLACDFNFFLNGLSPDTFLRKYVTKTNASYLRIGSNKFALYGRKEMRCTVYDSIRWGSRQSGVSVYMYNKSKELEEVKNKPWIREAWKKANLSSTKPVWRVEISITSQALGLKDMYSNLVHNLFVDELMSPELTRDMFKVYAAKYFRFVKTDPKAKRKRDLQPVALLDLTSTPAEKPVSLCESHDTGRMERICAGKLQKLYQYIADRDYNDKYEQLQAIEKTIVLFNSHHNLKQQLEGDTRAIEEHVTDVLSYAFDIPEKREMLSTLRRGRQDVEEWCNLVRDITRRVLIENYHAHCKSPSPRAVARNSLNAPM